MGAAMSAGVPRKAVKSAINVVSSVAHSINEGDSVGSTMLNAGKALISSNKNTIGQKIVKGNINLGFVGKVINRLTYEGKHLKYDALSSIKSDRLAKGISRTVSKLLDNYRGLI